MKLLPVVLVALALGSCGPAPSLLEQVRAAGELRVVTRNSPVAYYLGADGPEGPEYDLLRGFARHLGVELRIRETEHFADLLRAVEEGRADMAAAGLTRTPERAERVEFGPTYQQVEQYVIYRRGQWRPRSIEDLAGRRLEVVARSSYVDTLKAAREAAPDLVWTENPAADVGELLHEVARGALEVTIVDSNIHSIYRNFLPELGIAFTIREGDELAWAFPRNGDRSLIDEAGRYIARLRETGDLAYIQERYYGHKSRFDYVGIRTFLRDFRRVLPLYEPLFREAGQRHGIDWRLLAALGYQESHWEPLAISRMGARGLMMLTDNTARAMEVDDPHDPEQGIPGGARYLAKMYHRVEAHVPEPDRTWLALAAYNMGFAHLRDAREITRMNGGDPDRWVDVKESLPLLMQRRWYSRVRWGYARGWETRIFVDNVRNYYDILLWLTEDEDPVTPDDSADLPDLLITGRGPTPLTG